MSNNPDDHKHEDYYDEDEADEVCDRYQLSAEDCTRDDCGLRADGTCLLAGSEWCDWQCKSR